MSRIDLVNWIARRHALRPVGLFVRGALARKNTDHIVAKAGRRISLPIYGACLSQLTETSFRENLTDGSFHENDMFSVSPTVDTKTLEQIFPAKDGIFDRHNVFKMLLSKGKIIEDLDDMLMKRRHSGFNVFCGQGFSRERKRTWKPWHGISFGTHFHRRG